MQNILLGADPEIFVVRRDTGQFVSGHDLIPGTKAKPWPVPRGAVQVDGTSLEFNIDPAASADEFVLNIQTVMGAMRDMVPDDLDFMVTPIAHFDPNYFATLPEVAVELGCTPDYNAYTLRQNPRPDGDGRTFRTGAGHVHFGLEGFTGNDEVEHMMNCALLVKQLDASLARMAPCWDEDEQRRQLYGDLGAFRPKPYGVEYRTLSNAWLRDERLMRLVYDTSIAAVTALGEGDLWFEHPEDTVPPALAPFMERAQEYQREQQKG